MPLFDLRKICFHTSKSSIIIIGLLYLLWGVITPESEYLQVASGLFSFFLVILIPAYFIEYLNQFYLNKQVRRSYLEVPVTEVNLNDKQLINDFELYLLNRMWYKRKIVKPIVSGSLLKNILFYGIFISFYSFYGDNLIEFVQENNTDSFEFVFLLTLITFFLSLVYFFTKYFLYYSLFFLQPFVYHKKHEDEEGYIIYETYQKIVLSFKDGKLHHDYSAAFRAFSRPRLKERYFIKGQEVFVDVNLMKKMSKLEIKQYLNKLNNIKSF